MKIEEIRELIDLVTATGVAELEVQRGEDRVRIVRTASGGVHILSSLASPARSRLLPRTLSRHRRVPVRPPNPSSKSIPRWWQ